MKPIADLFLFLFEKMIIDSGAFRASKRFLDALWVEAGMPLVHNPRWTSATSIATLRAITNKELYMALAPAAGKITPLTGDTKRQAVDSILGYDYQIWRAAEAWMLLNQGEFLYIECAEDFDVVDAAGASMVQVKNSPKSITINSSDVKDAIQNFWTAKTKNTGRGEVTLRFLTRGEIGLERGKEFGERKGLELWADAAQGDAAAATTLASHLAASLGDAALVEFLKTADAPTLIEQLFNRVEWVAGEPSIEAVKISVKRLAIQKGARSTPPISAQIAAGSVDSILSKCRDTTVFKEATLRCLTTEDLQLVFEQSTSVPVPITGSLLAALGAMMAPQNTGTSIFVSAIANELPALQHPYLPRSEFVEAVVQSLSDASAVLIVGSEGRGKTTVASILGHKASGTKHWVDLSSHPDDYAVALAIENALMAVRTAAPPQCVILDDVPVAQGMPDQIWLVLRALIDSCRQRKVALILTAKGVAEDAVDSRFRSIRVKSFSVPALTTPEVEQFFSDLGCPQDRLSTWAKIALMQSGSGHPKLVYLHGLELQDNGWPRVTGDDLLAAPTSIDEARAHTRQVAAKVVLDLDRPFLYTLSVAIIPFERSVALAVGAGLSLGAPGESFDRLAGRWIEPRGDGRYSVTTMLNGQAQKIWADEKICEAHRRLFDAFVGRKAINASEAWAIFLHAYAGKEAGRIGTFLQMLLAQDFDKTPQFAESLETLLLVGSEPETPAVPFDRECSVLFRIVQFRIAKACRVEKMAEIAERWAWEIRRLPDEDRRAASRVIRGLSIACTMDGDFSPSVMVEAVRDASGYMTLNLFDAPPSPVVPGLDGNMPVMAWLFTAAEARCKTAEQLDQFLSALDQLDADIRDQMLKTFDGPYAQLGVSMVERAWLGERDASREDWQSFILILERAERLAQKWKNDSLRAIALQTLSLVYDEQLDDAERALQTLRESDLHGCSTVLTKQEANVLFRRDQFEPALQLWREALRRPEDSWGSTKSRDRFSMRKAAISAAKLNLFGEAADWFELAASQAMLAPAGVPAAAFRVDAAYCWFKQGDGLKMVNALTAAAVDLKGTYDSDSEFFLFAAQKNLGNTALWLKGVFQSIDRGGNEPFFGSASSPDFDREAYRSLPQGAYGITATMILEVANRLRVESDGTKELMSDLEKDENAIAAFQFHISKLEQTIERGRPSELAVQAHDLQVLLWRSAEAQKLKTDHLTPLSKDIPEGGSIETTTIEWFFLLGLLLQSVAGESVERLVLEWTSQLEGRARAADFKAILQDVYGDFTFNDGAPLQRVRKKSPDRSSFAAAAVFLSDERRNPKDTLYVQICLLYWLLGSPVKNFLKFSLEPLLSAFEKHWSQHISTPAFLFNPRVTVPMVEAAIASGGPSAKRMLLLLRAAGLACGISGNSIPESLLDFLNKAAAEQDIVEGFLKRRP